jgi:hypothetical protein
MTARCVNEGTMRLVRPLEDRAVSYCALDVAAGETITIATPFRIYATRRAADLPPLGDGSMRRTVRFGDGLEVDVVPNEYRPPPGGGSYAELAAARVDAASADACLLAGEPRFDGLYAFSPEGDVMGRAAVRLPNTTQLAPSTRVRAFVLGGLGCTADDGTTSPEGKWYEIERTMVSSDGRAIAISPGLPCLSWIAYRAE